LFCCLLLLLLLSRHWHPRGCHRPPSQACGVASAAGDEGGKRGRQPLPILERLPAPQASHQPLGLHCFRASSGTAALPLDTHWPRLQSVLTCCLGHWQWAVACTFTACHSCHTTAFCRHYAVLEFQSLQLLPTSTWGMLLSPCCAGAYAQEGCGHRVANLQVQLLLIRQTRPTGWSDAATEAQEWSLSGLIHLINHSTTPGQLLPHSTALLAALSRCL